MNDTQFIQKLEELAKNYTAQEKAVNLPYDVTDRNCATWVNMMFQEAGVPLEERNKLGKKWGIDWGEKDMFDSRYFGPPSGPKPEQIPFGSGGKSKEGGGTK